MWRRENRSLAFAHVDHTGTCTLIFVLMALLPAVNSPDHGTCGFRRAGVPRPRRLSRRWFPCPRLTIRASSTSRALRFTIVVIQFRSAAYQRTLDHGCWTFVDETAKDVMGHYPATQMMGTARVKDGALVLDGRGYALVSSRKGHAKVSMQLIPSYGPPKVQAGFYTPPHRVGEAWGGNIGVGDSPKGPFVGQKKNHTILGGQT